jgi:hypothetical protein
MSRCTVRLWKKRQFHILPEHPHLHTYTLQNKLKQPLYKTHTKWVTKQSSTLSITSALMYTVRGSLYAYEYTPFLGSWAVTASPNLPLFFKLIFCYIRTHLLAGFDVLMATLVNIAVFWELGFSYGWNNQTPPQRFACVSPYTASLRRRVVISSTLLLTEGIISSTSECYYYWYW